MIITLAIIFILVSGDNARITVIKKQDENSSCSILVNGGFAEPQPLILSADDRSNFVYPSKSRSGYLVARYGQSFRLACPGSQLHLDTIDSYDGSVITCIGENKFLLEAVNKIEESFENISCQKYPEYVAKRTGLPCNGGTMLEIGFSFLHSETSKKQQRKEFNRLIDLCHDETLGRTIWAHATIVAAIDAAQTSFPRTPFRKGNFFSGIQVAKVYAKDSQRESIAQILNSTRLASQYIPQSGSHYLARGHLIAKSDFIYGAHQRATFFYINAVPMWQNINAGNWGTMESNVRTYASKRRMDLDVWVGGYGILTLKDDNGRDREIFLHVNENKEKGRQSIPVPKILFKVVYNYPTQSGIVFVTANNPYITNLTKEYRICNDVCAKISYLAWNSNRPDAGLSYCCEVDDFRRVVTNIPHFVTKYLLL